MNPEWTYMKKLIWLAKRFGKATAHVAKSAYAHITDALATLFKSIKVYFEPKQAGTPVHYGTTNDPYILKKTLHGNTKFVSKLVGGTVVQNQLLPNGDFSSSLNWGGTPEMSFTVSDNIFEFTTIEYPSCGMWGSHSGNIYKDHKYLQTLEAKSNNPTNTFMLPYSSNQRFTKASPQSGLLSTTFTRYYSISNAIADQETLSYAIGLRTTSMATAGETIQVRNAMLIDLTLKFGTTIADFLYTLEQTTAGAGVAWLKQHEFLTKLYEPYNLGTLVSVSNLTAMVNRGINQWDEEWELGSLDANGQPTESTSIIRAKNYIPVLPNTTYCFTKLSSDGSILIFWYDASLNFIGTSNSVSSIANRISPDNAYYLRFRLSSGYGTTYNNDICINISDPSIDGNYYPSEVHSYPLDSTIDLNGIIKLDGNNEPYNDGDEYLPSGVVNRRYGIVDLGTLTWEKLEISSIAGAYYFRADLPNGTLRQNGITAMFVRTLTSGTSSLTADKTWSFSASYVGRIFVRDDAYASGTGADFKTAMSGQHFVYELAEPTTASATPYESKQTIVAGGTEEIVGSPIPVGHETEYANTFEIEGTNKVTVHRTGINQWDEEWELGNIDTSTGELIDANNRIRSKNFIPCLPQTSYYFQIPKYETSSNYYNRIFFYTSDGVYISHIETTINIGGFAFTTPSNCGLMKFRLATQYGITYNNDISMNYPSTDTSYHASSVLVITDVFPAMGANQWDEEWELGNINVDTGQPIGATDRGRSKNFIPVAPNTGYYFKTASGLTVGNVYFYDANKGYLFVSSQKGNNSFTTPSDCHYIKIMTGTAYGTIYNHDIAINYPSSVTTYEPFTNTVYGGTLDIVSGVLTVTKAAVRADSFDWEQYSSNPNGESFRSKNTGVVPFVPWTTGGSSSAMCNALAPSDTGSLTTSANNTFWWNDNRNSYRIVFGIPGVTTAGDLKAFLSSSNAIFVGLLNTPQTIQLTPQQVQALLGENNIWADEGEVEVYYSKGL